MGLKKCWGRNTLMSFECCVLLCRVVLLFLWRPGRIGLRPPSRAATAAERCRPVAFDSKVFGRKSLLPHEPLLQDFFRDAIGVEAAVLPNARPFVFWTSPSLSGSDAG